MAHLLCQHDNTEYKIFFEMTHLSTILKIGSVDELTYRGVVCSKMPEPMCAVGFAVLVDHGAEIFVL